MMRISDILRRKPRLPQEEIVKPVSEVKQDEQMQLNKAMRIEPDMEGAKNIYNRGCQLAEKLFKYTQGKKSVEIEGVKDLIETITNYFIAQDRALLSLFYDDYPVQDYLNYHTVNVVIMSIGLGIGLKYNKSQLNELGLAAFLHDIGMVELKDIALKHGKLSQEEYKKVKEHPVRSAELISAIKDIPQSVIRAVKEQHEWSDGTGYPQKLKDEEICEYARIICVSDTYEALTHNRTYRGNFSSYDAVKMILTSDASHFNSEIVKILITQVGVYPVGSWVELNTNEIGKVINTYEEFPLRPVVNLIYDSSKSQFAQSKMIDLRKHYNIYIKKPLTNKELQEKLSK